MKQPRKVLNLKDEIVEDKFQETKELEALPQPLELENHIKSPSKLVDMA